MTLAIRLQVFKAYVAFPWLTAVVVSLLQTPVCSLFRAVLDMDEKSFPSSLGFPSSLVLWSSYVGLLRSSCLKEFWNPPSTSLRYDALAPICADCCKGDTLPFSPFTFETNNCSSSFGEAAARPGTLFLPHNLFLK